MPRTCTRCCVLGLWLLACATRVQAAPPFELFGAVTASGGYSARTTGAYFLPHARPGVEPGLFVVQDSIDISLGTRSPGVDVPEAALGQAPYAGQMYPSLVVDEWSDSAVNNRGEPIAAASGLRTNNPGWPGFGSSGVLRGAGAHVGVAY